MNDSVKVIEILRFDIRGKLSFRKWVAHIGWHAAQKLARHGGPALGNLADAYFPIIYE